MRAKLQSIRAELRKRMHLPIREQAKWLGQVVRGYFAYHAVPTNGRALTSFRFEAVRHWHRALRRRGQRHRITWERTQRVANRWVPAAKILHPWPDERFDVNHPR
jgi:RNA-directed DNA polymerase